jgi:hypothetical protein
LLMANGQVDEFGEEFWSIKRDIWWSMDDDWGSTKLDEVW